MTEAPTPIEEPGGDPRPSGLDLARVALHAARAAAKKHGATPRGPRRRDRAVRRDGREPQGVAAVLQGLMADRAWEVPTAGGTVLDRWPAIAAAVAAQLPDHVQAVRFDAGTGRLDLRPDSPAYATQLRLISARIIAAANEHVGTDAVRTLRVLPPGPAAPAAPPAPAAAPEALGKEPVMASPGYQRALAAHQAALPDRRLDPAIRAAAERQEREQAREPEDLFRDGQVALREETARTRAVSSTEASRARALARLADERAGHASGARRLDRTA